MAIRKNQSTSVPPAVAGGGADADPVGADPVGGYRGIVTDDGRAWADWLHRAIWLELMFRSGLPERDLSESEASWLRAVEAWARHRLSVLGEHYAAVPCNDGAEITGSDKANG